MYLTARDIIATATTTDSAAAYQFGNALRLCGLANPTGVSFDACFFVGRCSCHFTLACIDAAGIDAYVTGWLLSTYTAYQRTAAGNH